MARRASRGDQLARQLTGKASNGFRLRVIDRPYFFSRGRNCELIRRADPMLAIKPAGGECIDVARYAGRDAMLLHQPRNCLLRNDPAFARHRSSSRSEPGCLAFLRIELRCSRPCRLDQSPQLLGKSGVNRPGRYRIWNRQARIDCFRRSRSQARFSRRGGRAARSQQ